MDAQFSLFERAPQVTFKSEKSHRPGVHCGIKNLITCFTLILRSIHRSICISNDVLSLFITGSAERYSNTGSCDRFMISKFERGRDRLLNFFCNSYCFCWTLQTVDQYCELIATETCDQIRLPNTHLETARN